MPVQSEASLGEALLRLEPSTVKCLLGADFDTVRRCLERRSPDPCKPLVLAQRLDRIPPGSRLIDIVLESMAVTARNLWPVWFTDVDFGLGRSALDRATVRLRLADLQCELPRLSVTWGRHAVRRAIDARPPLIAKFPRAFQLGQLSLAISRTGLIVLLAIEDRCAKEGHLLNLASATQWLARHGGISVAVALPAELADHPALAHILFDPIVCASMDSDLNVGASGPVIAGELSQRTTLWISLGGGRTHPLSKCEAKLAAALAADPELGSLFSANQPIETIYGNRHVVDLLWSHGRVVVEVDGADHRQPQKFAADRRRDFELFVSGFSVLRLVDDEVMIDTAKAIEQIRQVVSYQRQTGLNWKG